MSPGSALQANSGTGHVKRNSRVYHCLARSEEYRARIHASGWPTTLQFHPLLTDSLPRGRESETCISPIHSKHLTQPNTHELASSCVPERGIDLAALTSPRCLTTRSAPPHPAIAGLYGEEVRVDRTNRSVEGGSSPHGQTKAKFFL